MGVNDPLEVLEQYGFIFELANIVLITVLVFLPILYLLKKIWVRFCVHMDA